MFHLYMLLKPYLICRFIKIKDCSDWDNPFDFYMILIGNQ